MKNDLVKVRQIRVALEGLEARAEASEIAPADVRAVLELVYELEPVQHAVAAIASRIAGRAQNRPVLRSTKEDAR